MVQGAAGLMKWIFSWHTESSSQLREQMVSAATRPQHSGAPLECGGTGGGHHRHAVEKSSATVQCCVNMDPNLRGVFPVPSFIHATAFILMAK